MYQFLFHIGVTLIEALIPAVCLLPAVIVLCSRKHFSVGLTAKYSLFLFYLCAVYSFTGLPTLSYLSWEPEMYLYPFVGIADDLENSILNVALFVPMGFFLPMLCKRFESGVRTMLFGLCATLFIELAQLFNFRLTDINDVIYQFCRLCAGLYAGVAASKRENSGKAGNALWHGGVRNCI